MKAWAAVDPGSCLNARLFRIHTPDAPCVDGSCTCYAFSKARSRSETIGGSPRQIMISTPRGRANALRPCDGLIMGDRRGSGCRRLMSQDGVTSSSSSLRSSCSSRVRQVPNGACVVLQSRYGVVSANRALRCSRIDPAVTAELPDAVVTAVAVVTSRRAYWPTRSQAVRAATAYLDPSGRSLA